MPPPATQSSLAECSPLISRAYAQPNCTKLSQEVSCLKARFEELLEEAHRKSAQLSKLRAEAQNQTVQWYVSQIKPSLLATEERLREQVEYKREMFKVIDGLSNDNNDKWSRQSRDCATTGMADHLENKLERLLLSNAADVSMLRQRVRDY